MNTAQRLQSRAKRNPAAWDCSVIRINQDQLDELDYDESEICSRCDGEGRVMVCCDDLCRSSWQCIYDGTSDASCFQTCHQCNGAGEV